MFKLVVFLLCMSAWCSLARGGHHHDTTGSTSSSTTGSTHSSDSSDTTSSDSTSSDSHHHSDHHRNGESYSSHDHDMHHRHGDRSHATANKIRREARWTNSDERSVARRMRVALDAAKLRSSGSSSRAASDYDVARPAVLLSSGAKKIKTE